MTGRRGGFLLVCALAFLVAGVYLVVEAVRRIRAGTALAHLFDHGMVLERVRDRLDVLPRAGAAVDFVTWEESGGDNARTKVQLWVTLPDGTVATLDTWTDDERVVLRQIAAHFGLPAEPRPAEERALRVY